MRRKRYQRYAAAILGCVLFAAGMLQILSGGSRSGRGTGGDATQSRLEFSEEDQGQAVSGDTIRVLLMTTGYEGEVHREVEIFAESGLLISRGAETIEWNKKDAYTVKADDARLKRGSLRIRPMKEGDRIVLESVERGCGAPAYDGVLELWGTSEGIAVVNELSVEDYLCAVVPSEMPASYDLEALKAQAVCARSYAFRQMQSYAYPEYKAHVNDSTDFQVYNNSQRMETSTQAVKETAGQAVIYRGETAVTYYYSTSCGETTDVRAWGSKRTEKNGYLKSVSVSGSEGDYEQDLPWYRWSAAIGADTMTALIRANTGTDIGQVSAVEVTERGPGDVAVRLKVTGSRGTVTVETENKIRTALGGSGYMITKNDGTKVESTALLPSAFFTVERQGDTFVIEGGGYGHGIGMSQNGANEMAKQGKDYKEILELFYPGARVG